MHHFYLAILIFVGQILQSHAELPFVIDKTQDEIKKILKQDGMEKEFHDPGHGVFKYYLYQYENFDIEIWFKEGKSIQCIFYRDNRKKEIDPEDVLSLFYPLKDWKEKVSDKGKESFFTSTNQYLQATYRHGGKSVSVFTTRDYVNRQKKK